MNKKVKFTQESWEYDAANDRWICRNYPTYAWTLPSSGWVYDNPDMLAVIEQNLANTDEFPEILDMLDKLR
jgi:hypothetical protein